MNMQIQGQSYADVLKDTKSHDKEFFKRYQDIESIPSKGKIVVIYNDHMHQGFIIKTSRRMIAARIPTTKY